MLERLILPRTVVYKSINDLSVLLRVMACFLQLKEVVQGAGGFAADDINSITVPMPQRYVEGYVKFILGNECMLPEMKVNVRCVR